MYASQSDQSFWTKKQERLDPPPGLQWMTEPTDPCKEFEPAFCIADQDILGPPPGLDGGAEHTDPFTEKMPAMIVTDNTDSISGVSSDCDEPMKVKLPGDTSGNADWAADTKVVALAMENESLFSVNEQLARENAMLRQYGSNIAIDNLGAQDWWARQWSMPPSRPHPTTEPGDIVFFHGLQVATELNNQYGIIDRWDSESQRWVVLTVDDEERFARPENLFVVRDAHHYAQQGCHSMYGMAQSTQVSGASKAGRTNKKITREKSWSFASDSTTASVRSDSKESQDGHEATTARTSVMMRNIPNDYSSAMLLDLFNDMGFEGCYRLVYLPIDYRCKASFGYAFIDLTTPADATRFRDVFEGFGKWKVGSSKKCTIDWSNLQGVQAHIDRYRNSPVMHAAVADEFKPMLFENGRRVPLPPPTKTIRAPRLKRV